MLAANYLISKKEKHSKSENLTYSTQMQTYLRNESLKIKDKMLMFRLRNRLIDAKSNFKRKYNNELLCRLCMKTEESQLHMTLCEVVLSNLEIKKALEDYSYMDTFSQDVKTQTHMINVWKQILRIFNHHEDSSYQASPDTSGASYIVM